MRFSHFLSKMAKLLRTTALPSQFGFVQCHSYLSEKQLDRVRGLLESKDDAEKRLVVSEYERKFATLVGSGHATSFASSRMALYALMKALAIGEGDEVVLTAFTCAVIPNAVMKLGARPVYADIDKYTFGSSAREIEKVITGKTKMIVAQHSFGIPCEIDKIAILAKEKGIVLVEDCAITLDSSLKGVKVGNWGDAAIFSTDHSKPLNTMIGGIFYTKDPGIHAKVERLAGIAPQLSDEHQNNLYKQLLFEKGNFVPARYPRAKIRSYIHNMRKRIQGIPTAIFLEDNYVRPRFPGEGYPYPAAMPAFLAQLGIYELERWDEQRARRKKLCSQFIDKMKSNNMDGAIPSVYNDQERDIVPHRFVFTSTDADEILHKLSLFVDINWIWFRQPIIMAEEGLESLQYAGKSCPVSEKAAEEIINIPSNVVEGAEHELLQKLERLFTNRISNVQAG